MDANGLRAHFPVLERQAYLNAGTDGPVPRVGVEAARAELESELAEGRFTAHFQRRFALQDELRGAYARLLCTEPENVALQTSTSEGLGRVLAGMDLGPADDILSSDQEHPGLLGPLKAARERGARIRTAPIGELADHVTQETTLVACSHVGWVSGELADPRLAELDLPVVLDGAQGAGAIATDVRALRCAAYAAAGQKWLCGADGTGLLYLEPGFRERLRCVAPSYMSFERTDQGLDGPLKADARRHDTPALAREVLAMSVAAIDLLETTGWEAVHSAATGRADELVERLAAAGRTVAPRDATTLVAWEDADPEATRDRLWEQDIVVRNLPGTALLRASVGAWTSPEDLDRLLGALG